MDVFVARSDVETLRALIATASRDLERAGVDYVKAAFSDPWARGVARALGFVDPARWLPEARRPGPRLLVTGGALSRYPAVADMSAWWLTRGDSELDLTDMPPGSEVR